ncbi:MAG: geranylgeranylglycerol-phosphate geranylgeranyltransferase [Flavobacteriaceae bacterium]|nr:geranylgeranylglycerol-phosphate geranylgeranyltransferase [Flavobacteriaceae bacterium]
MFSVVRGYNIGLIILAQYLTSVFILAPNVSVLDVLLDPYLFAVVLATVGAVASGYIINNFYDQEKDLINRPQKFVLERMVSQQTKLKLYFILNFLVLLSASAISFRAVLFFVAYIFAIWFYSHKIKKMPLIGNLTSALLSISPFFAIFLYFKNLNQLIYVFGFYLFLILATRELIKDLESIKGDLALDYKTVPVVYGERLTKRMISILVLINIVVSLFLVLGFDLGLMDYFFLYSILTLVVALTMTWSTSSQKRYNSIHNILKLLIFLGVLSITLLNPELIINKIF